MTYSSGTRLTAREWAHATHLRSDEMIVLQTAQIEHKWGFRFWKDTDYHHPFTAKGNPMIGAHIYLPIPITNAHNVTRPSPTTTCITCTQALGSCDLTTITCIRCRQGYKGTLFWPC
jgi:hypothetical protein